MESARSLISTLLDTCKHMRYMANNEVPSHDVFDTDSLKPLSEMRGAGIVSRTIYDKPERWLPMGGVFLTSNFPMSLADYQRSDSGWARRLNYMHLNGVFKEGDGSTDVKDAISAKTYNAELFWWARLFVKYLHRCSPSRTRIWPRPPRLRRETEELLNGSRKDELLAWLEAFTEPAPMYSAGSLTIDLKKAMSDIMDMPIGREFETLLSECKVFHKRTTDKRVLTYQYPGTTRISAIRFKSQSTAAHSVEG